MPRAGFKLFYGNFQPSTEASHEYTDCLAIVIRFLGRKPIDVEPTDEQLSSDAGPMLIRQFDEQIGLTAEFAAALRDDHVASRYGRSSEVGAEVRKRGWQAGRSEVGPRRRRLQIGSRRSEVLSDFRSAPPLVFDP